MLDCVDPSKDVDGLHPVNTGLLAQRGRRPLHTPCTPQGIMRLLARSGVPLEGAEAVVIGRSNIVGLPTALLLLAANATVTVAHSRTRGLPEIVRRVRAAHRRRRRRYGYAFPHPRRPPPPPRRHRHRRRSQIVTLLPPPARTRRLTWSSPPSGARSL